MPESRSEAPPTIAIVAAGAMGASVGSTLVSHGVPVLTCIEGRSAATRERALRARMQLASRAELGSADLLLSTVPSDQAVCVAQALLEAGALREGGALYVDCNPLNPATLATLSQLLARAGCGFVDACILGVASSERASARVRLCTSGPRAAELDRLAAYGLEIQRLSGPLGTASALRLGISAVSKGLVALLTLVAAPAEASGVGALLYQELHRSHAALLDWVARQSARLPTEAQRWSAELQEVAGGPVADARARVFAEMAQYFADLAASPTENALVSGALTAFFGRTPQPARNPTAPP